MLGGERARKIGSQVATGQEGTSLEDGLGMSRDSP